MVWESGMADTSSSWMHLDTVSLLNISPSIPSRVYESFLDKSVLSRLSPRDAVEFLFSDQNRYAMTHMNDGRKRGPSALMKYLLSGLASLRTDFNYNPSILRVNKNVGVLSNTRALEWAIKQKRAKKIDRLVAGPNLVIDPLDCDSILLSKEIDVVVTPSRWPTDYFLSKAPSLSTKIREWACGVDTDLWTPSPEIGSQWLIYDKTDDRSKAILGGVKQALDRESISYEIIRYGDYNQSEYLDKLHRSAAMVFLSNSESQGLALFEAWSCNVPTLVYDRRYWEYEGRSFHSECIIPYVNDINGVRFETINDIDRSLSSFQDGIDRNGFHPRDFVLSKYTLEKAARAYLELFDI